MSRTFEASIVELRVWGAVCRAKCCWFRRGRGAAIGTESRVVIRVTKGADAASEVALQDERRNREM